MFASLLQALLSETFCDAVSFRRSRVCLCFVVVSCIAVTVLVAVMTAVVVCCYQALYVHPRGTRVHMCSCAMLPVDAQHNHWLCDSCCGEVLSDEDRLIADYRNVIHSSLQCRELTAVRAGKVMGFCRICFFQGLGAASNRDADDATKEGGESESPSTPRDPVCTDESATDPSSPETMRGLS